MVKKTIKKKPIYNIAMASRFVTATEKYVVNHGKSGGSASKYNNSGRHFSKRKDAIAFKNKLIDNKRKSGFNVRYIYLAD